MKNNILCNLTVDVITQPSIKETKIIGEKGTLVCDYSLGQIKIGKNEKWKTKKIKMGKIAPGYKGNTGQESLYEDEMRYFVKCIKNKEKQNYSFKDELEILQILDLIENSSKKAKKLKWLHTSSAGVDEYLIPELIKSNITFTNGKIIQGPEIADHAIGLLLCITRNLHFYIKNVYKKINQRPIELKGKTCGILGLGGIGLCIAERLKRFDMKIVGISEELIPLLSFVDEFYTSEKLLEVLPKLDVFICTAPLTKNTFNLIDEKHLKKMKKGSVFINVSRGEVVKTSALLKNNLYLKFRGVGLDVTNPEPLSKNHKLNNLNNVILTKHSAGHSDKNRERAYDLIVLNIKRFLKNKHLLNIVDKVKGY